MNKILFKKIVLIIIALIICFSSLINRVSYAESINDNNYVYLGGFTVGFSIDNRGATIAGLSDIITDSGIKSPAKDCNLKENDIILEINNKEINNAKDIEKVVNNDSSVLLTIKRNDEIKLIKLKPVKDIYGKYRIGVLIKENITGIGTITYISNNKFASLGHPILDDENKVMQICGGNIYNCNIIGFVKGEKGIPGELKGITDNTINIGNLSQNSLSGVYGNISSDYQYDSLKKIELGEGKIGDAKIVSNIEGYIKEYDIQIVKSDISKNHLKNFVVKITDNRLLNLTGGIVQGMSGSPIIQDNKLVGAITHVFINDPVRGFGISISNMINH